jgi:hypothetical protein
MNQDERAAYWAKEARSWSGVVRRPALAVALSFAIAMTSIIALMFFGSSAVESSGWFFVSLAVVSVATGLGFCLRRSWRPVVSAASGAAAVGFAWFAAEVSSFDNPVDSHITVEMATTAFGFALAYVLIFRPMGEEIKQETRDEHLRMIIRAELLASMAPLVSLTPAPGSAANVDDGD